MADTANFRVDPSNYLGLQFSEFKNKLYKLALTNPERFFELRERVFQTIQKDMCNNLYTTVVNLLSDGKDVTGRPLVVIDGTPIKIGFPSQKINEIALSFTESLSEMMQELTELIIPRDFNTILDKKLKITPGGPEV
jgi:arsenate reductase-like glutaredoxin family protein